MTSYDRVILGGRVVDPASDLDDVRNIGIVDGRVEAITTDAVRGRDVIDMSSVYLGHRRETTNEL